ncbi:MAG TPA: YoaK family protein [Solirubrobacteraceae bacterium]|nr:YoaK family protein [Solirubrobacteraceae bacterium]
MRSSNPPSDDGPPGRSERASGSLRAPLTLTLLALTFGSGMVDAVSYLGLGRVFTANMTGNVVLLGFGIAQSGGLPILPPAISLGAFALGAGAGGLLGSKLGHRHTVHVGAAWTFQATLIACATILAAAAPPHAGSVSRDVVIGTLALAMGLQTATARRLAVPDLPTTVLTQTVTGLVADSRLFGGTGKGTARRGSAVAAMLVGAVAGALLLKASLVLALALTGALLLLVQLGYLWATRR